MVEKEGVAYLFFVYNLSSEGLVYAVVSKRLSS